MQPIDKTSSIPYYLQLADILRQEIAERQSSAQVYQLPSENDLATLHAITRTTVRHALDVPRVAGGHAPPPRRVLAHPCRGILPFALSAAVGQCEFFLQNHRYECIGPGWRRPTTSLQTT
mgnify:CR=1 FL=1